jgi:hypothetical protein
MVTIGDVFTVIGILVGICVTGWALIMGSAVLFQKNASQARDVYRGTPWKGFFVGLGATVVLGFFSVVLASLPNPVAKLMGTTLYLSLMALAALGASGIALQMTDRVSALDPNLSRYAALSRSAFIMVVAGVFPVLGWFFVGPLLIISSIGCALTSLLSRQKSLVAPPFEVV